LDKTLGLIVAYAPLVLALLGPGLFALALWWASCHVDQKRGSDTSGEVFRRSVSEHDVEESKAMLESGAQVESEWESEGEDERPEPADTPLGPADKPPEAANGDDADTGHV